MEASACRNIVVTSLIGVMGIGGIIAPVDSAASGMLGAPTIALAGTAAAEGHYGTRLVGWCETNTTYPGKSVVVHIKVEGLTSDSVMPTKIVDPFDNELAFDANGEVEFQLVTVGPVSSNRVIILPVTENPDDWRMGYDMALEHLVDGSWVFYDKEDWSHEIDIVFQGYNGRGATLSSYAAELSGVDCGLFDYMTFFNGNYGVIGYDPFWRVEYSNGLSFEAFPLSWSTDSRHLAKREGGLAVFPVPSRLLYESSMSDPYVDWPTGSGATDLTMIIKDTTEHGGPAVDPSNPDETGGGEDGQSPDGLGDNLAFTVPAAINYVVRSDGSLIGPSDGTAYIENRSAFPTHVSALDVDEKQPFSIVSDALSVDTPNAVDVAIGPADGRLDAASYLDKTAVSNAFRWNMTAATDGTADQVALGTSGHVANISADITSKTSFGTMRWFVTPGTAQPPHASVYYLFEDGAGLQQIADLSLLSTPTGFVFADGISPFDTPYLEVSIMSGMDMLVTTEIDNTGSLTWEMVLDSMLAPNGLTWDDVVDANIYFIGRQPTQQEI